MYGYNTDNYSELKGYIDRDKILKYITQEELFEIAFGFYPVELEYITSPNRPEDINPGCWFSYSSSGILRFYDYANQSQYLNIKLYCMDCFDAIQYKFNLRNFFQTLEFIKNHIILKKSLKPIKKTLVVTSNINKRHETCKILINPERFLPADEKFWWDFEITIKQLQEDKVFALQGFKIISNRGGTISSKVESLAYCYTNFKKERKKIYIPNNEKTKKFFTNCTENDIGEIDKLPEKGKQLIITKSYKDCRILRNQGIYSIWFQNEGMTPREDLCINLLERFDDIVIFFDNDNAGIKATQKVRSYLNSLLINEVRSINLPLFYIKNHITDPGDLVKNKSILDLKQFLYQNKIKIQ